MAKISDLINKMNANGIPIPLLKIDGKSTFTGTMTFISFNTCLFGQFGKFADFLKGVDLAQANYLFMICLGAYLGRRFQGNGTTIKMAAGAKKGESK